MKQLESVKLIQFLLYEQQEFGLEEVTGIFGRNGSGKSSALDAVQIALFGANKNLLAFNAQADSGARQQNRTLRSYCLGQYGDDSDQCARTQATTYITLVWRDNETHEPVSMGVCIEASSDSEGDHHRIGVPGVIQLNLLQCGEQCRADVGGSAFALEAAVGVDEAADAMRL